MYKIKYISDPESQSCLPRKISGFCVSSAHNSHLFLTAGTSCSSEQMLGDLLLLYVTVLTLARHNILHYTRQKHQMSEIWGFRHIMDI